METILDAGAAGLRYFALYLPRAAVVAERLAIGERLTTYEDVEARYFEQRGIDLGALDADIEVLTKVAADLDDRFDDQESMVPVLEEAWAGADADRAREHLGTHLARADLVRRNVAEVRCALVETSRTLREAVTRKADWVGARDASRAGGLTPEQIDTAMSGAACADALTDLFLPHVRDTVSAFTALCDATATAVDDAYRSLACVFAQIDDSAFPVPGPLVVGECGGPTVAPPAVCRESPAVPAAVVTGGAAGTTSPAGGTSLAGLGAPPGVGPVSPPRGSLVGGGSLALDGLVVEGTARAVGAIVGVVADVALEVVDAVGDLVREAAAETVEEADARCSLNLDREPCCDGAPEPRDSVPEECPASDPPIPVEEPAADDDCPEPEPESETPSPAAELPAAQLPAEQPVQPEPQPQPEPVELQPTEPQLESCVPAVTPPAHPALGARPATGSRAAAEPALAELGSEPPAPDGAGAEIAEAGPL